MTSNRRAKTKIRRLQTESDIPYSVARRRLSTTAADIESPDPTELLPPLKAWTTWSYCNLWTKNTAEHGPLMAVRVSEGPDWSVLDDIVRAACGALQDRPLEERDLWIAMVPGSYSVTKRDHLPAVLEGMRAAGALSRLTVRSIPDGAHCDHARCRRRRGEPITPRPVPPSAPAIDSMSLGPLRTLAEVMEQHPELSHYGIGVFYQPGRTPDQRRAEVAEQRRTLVAHEGEVMRIAAWLRENVTPIKTTTIGSYDMKHIVENAIGTYVSNGELTAAALVANYPHRYTDSPNLRLGMSKRDVHRLRNARSSS